MYVRPLTWFLLSLLFGVLSFRSPDGRTAFTHFVAKCSVRLTYDDRKLSPQEWEWGSTQQRLKIWCRKACPGSYSVLEEYYSANSRWKLMFNFQLQFQLELLNFNLNLKVWNNSNTISPYLVWLCLTNSRRSDDLRQGGAGYCSRRNLE